MRAEVVDLLLAIYKRVGLQKKENATRVLFFIAQEMLHFLHMHDGNSGHSVSNDSTGWISYCPQCENSFQPHQYKTLAEREEAVLLHIECNGCYVGLTALVMITSTGITSIGQANDLTCEDAKKFMHAPPIDIDAIIEIHNELKLNEPELRDYLILANQ